MTTHSLADKLQRQIEASNVRAGVIGLGYVGLPLAVEFARAGYTVVGLDVDEGKVETTRQAPHSRPRVGSRNRLRRRRIAGCRQVTSPPGRLALARARHAGSAFAAAVRSSILCRAAELPSTALHGPAW